MWTIWEPSTILPGLGGGTEAGSFTAAAYTKRRLGLSSVFQKHVAKDLQATFHFRYLIKSKPNIDGIYIKGNNSQINNRFPITWMITNLSIHVKHINICVYVHTCTRVSKHKILNQVNWKINLKKWLVNWKIITYTI